MEFESRDEVLIWIISTQVGRRNLGALQLSFYRGLHYNADKRIVTNASGKNQYSEVVYQNDKQPKPQSTVSRIAEQYNVSTATISRDSQVANAINAIGEVSPDVKMDILSGKTHISRRKLQELSSGTDEDVFSVVEKIKDGTLERRRSGARGAHDESADEIIDSDELRPWEMQFGRMTDEFRSVLRGHAKLDDTESVRSALRDYIGMLEELYMSI